MSQQPQKTIQPQQPTIIFDWNCTLLDDMDLIVDATNIFLKHAEKPLLDKAGYQEHFTMPVTAFYNKIGVSAEELAEKYTALQDIFHGHYHAGEHTIGLRTGGEALLQTLHAQSLNNVILSNHITSQIITQLHRLAIEHYFHDVLAYADRASQFKHETKGQRLGRYIQEHNLTPETCMIIGDTVEEIEIARDYGLVSVAITGGFFSTSRLEAAKPDHLVHSLSEFHDVLRQHNWLREVAA